MASNLPLKIQQNKVNGQRFINIPKEWDFKEDDEVLLKKVKSKIIIEEVKK